MNPIRLLFFFLILGAGAAGFLVGKKDRPANLSSSAEDSGRIQEFPVVENKTFAVIIYACNQGVWCEKALKSIFEQDYDYFRIVFIDDASNDDTFARAKNCVIDHGEEHRTVLIRNEKREGLIPSLQRAANGCLDREIALFFNAKDWFAHSSVLTRLNAAFQDPAVWLVSSSAVQYPSYSKTVPEDPNAPLAFYAGMIKAAGIGCDLAPILKMAKGHIQLLPEPTLFVNGSGS